MRRETFLPPADMTPAGESKGFNLSRWAIDHGGFTAFLLLLLLAAGAFSFLRIGQKEDPDLTVSRDGRVGALAQRDGRGDARPGRPRLRRSYTRTGFANIFVNLKGSMREEAVKEAFYQARKKIGDIRQTLPDGMIGPFFNDEFGDTLISLYAITGQGFAYPELNIRPSRKPHATFCSAFPASQKSIS